MAVEHADRILYWQENLMTAEIPPAWMWHLEWELDIWFAEVERKRNERSGPSSDPWDSSQDQGMSQNKLAAAFRKGRKG